MPMVNNSTLFFIFDDRNNENEIIDFNGLHSLEDEYSEELNLLFNSFDYSPSDEVVKRILTLI